MYENQYTHNIPRLSGLAHDSRWDEKGQESATMTKESIATHLDVSEIQGKSWRQDSMYQQKDAERYEMRSYLDR